MLVSEAGPTVVALGGLSVAAAGLVFGWLERRRALAHERTLHDLDAVRSLIEDGAVHLHDIAYALDKLVENLPDNADEIQGELRVRGKRYDELVERMKVRLGPDHETTREFIGANEAVLEIFRGLQLIQMEHAAGAPLRSDAIERVGKQRARVTAARATFDHQRVRFVDAAARTAGAKLSSR